MTTTQKRREVRRKQDDEIVDLPESEKKDRADLDALLEEIDTILEDDEAEKRRSFREKIRSLNFIRKPDIDPCRDVIEVSYAEAHYLVSKGLASFYDGPPCVGC